ncbi:hypothetical protein ES703_46306 [subsurface metagenome]|jgi:hypothetical protein
MHSRISGTAAGAYDAAMANSIWTLEQFTCPGCGMNYTATKEELLNKRSGAFACIVCDAEVHKWSGRVDFFDWTAKRMASPVFGRKR